MASDKKSPKKQQNRKPTVNQQKVLDKVAEQVRKGQKISVSKAMREVGYSKNTAAKPGKITKTPAWKELMDKFLPDSKLAKVHDELLTRKELIRTTDVVTGNTTLTASKFIDVQAAKAGLDMAYKLKGHYEPEKHAVTHAVSLKDLYLSDEDAAK